MTSYICPNCKRKQTDVIIYQRVLEFWNYNLKNKEYTDCVDKNAGEIEGYQCPECGSELSFKKFGKALWK